MSDDWAQRVVGEATARAVREAKDREERGRRALEVQKVEPSAEEKQRLRDEAEQQRAEAIAARVQDAVRRQQRNRRPYSTYDKQMITQALGGESSWDQWDGPGAA